MENLVGRKVKGFKFEGCNLYYNSNMDEYIGQVGVILNVNIGTSEVKVRFKDDWFYYPLNQIKDHLVPEYEIGKEYEFSDDGERWTQPMRLVGVIDHEFKYIVEDFGCDVVGGYKQIREIKPKVKELTLEEIAEKFGCDVSEIKIKK